MTEAELVEDRVFRRVSRAMRFVEEQVRLGRGLRIGWERELELAARGQMRWPSAWED